MASFLVSGIFPLAFLWWKICMHFDIWSKIKYFKQRVLPPYDQVDFSNFQDLNLLNPYWTPFSADWFYIGWARNK